MTECIQCQQGGVPIGEHFITHDMASDAGEPAMEGMSMGIEWGVCPCCQGYWQECPNCSAPAALGKALKALGEK